MDDNLEPKPEDIIADHAYYRRQASGWRRLTIMQGVTNILLVASLIAIFLTNSATLNKLNKQSDSIAANQVTTQRSSSNVATLISTINCNNLAANKLVLQAVIDALEAQHIITGVVVTYPTCKDK